MTEEIVRYEDKPLQAVEIRTQVNLIQEVMKSVMQKGQHYGTVPGCGDKPTLLKPGAEKLMMTFRLAAEPQITDIPCEDGITFRVVCRITNQNTGVYLGSGVGEASTKEDKYNWRKAICDGEYDNTSEDKRRLKWVKGYHGEIDHIIKQVRTNPADLSNTVLKIAKKRSLVDGVLTVTAASDIFTQDIEDMAEEVLDKSKVSKEASVKPLEKEGKVCGAIGEIITKSGTKNNKKWQAWTIIIDAVKYGTFSRDFSEKAIDAKAKGLQVEIEYKVGDYGREIISLKPLEPADNPSPKKNKPLHTANALIELLKSCNTRASLDNVWNEFYGDDYTDGEKADLFEWREKLLEGLK